MKQKSNLLMRVSNCKIQCPSFFSLCKPSRASNLYTHTTPLKLENTQNTPSSNPVSVVSVVDDDGGDGLEKVNGSNTDGNEGIDENTLKSCVRKKKVCGESDGGFKEKKRVQWVDNFGKVLVEIKEFESCDTGDTDNELENRTCSCLTL